MLSTHSYIYTLGEDLYISCQHFAMGLPLYKFFITLLMDSHWLLHFIYDTLIIIQPQPSGIEPKSPLMIFKAAKKEKNKIKVKKTPNKSLLPLHFSDEIPLRGLKHLLPLLFKDPMIFPSYIDKCIAC